MQIVNAGAAGGTLPKNLSGFRKAMGLAGAGIAPTDLKAAHSDMVTYAKDISNTDMSLDNAAKNRTENIASQQGMEAVSVVGAYLRSFTHYPGEIMADQRSWINPMKYIATAPVPFGSSLERSKAERDKALEDMATLQPGYYMREGKMYQMQRDQLQATKDLGDAARK